MRTLIVITEMAIGCRFGGWLFGDGTVSPSLEVCPVHMTQEKSRRGNSAVLQLQKLRRKKCSGELENKYLKVPISKKK